MKTKITSLLTSVIGAFLFCGCDTDVEPLEIQKLKTYDEQYFQNIRVRRLPYTRDEKSNNQVGVNSGIAALGGPDTGGTKLWWEQRAR